MDPTSCAMGIEDSESIDRTWRHATHQRAANSPTTRWFHLPVVNPPITRCFANIHVTHQGIIGSRSLQHPQNSPTINKLSKKRLTNPENVVAWQYRHCLWKSNPCRCFRWQLHSRLSALGTTCKRSENVAHHEPAITPLVSVRVTA